MSTDIRQMRSHAFTLQTALIELGVEEVELDNASLNRNDSSIKLDLNLGDGCYTHIFINANGEVAFSSTGWNHICRDPAGVRGLQIKDDGTVMLGGVSNNIEGLAKALIQRLPNVKRAVLLKNNLLCRIKPVKLKRG
jgi:hypothetical protein